ncbi:MAG: hypothetical protein VB042_08795 [Victivallaceae bacterium]|nr:hypothetical protein [Victivallaceae bacterium]
MRYVKQVGNAIVEYTGPALGSEHWYTETGWTPYAGELPASRLSIVDGAVVELPAPEVPRLISKLKLKRKLAGLGAWDTFLAALADGGYSEDFDLAVNLSTADPAFQSALAGLAALADGLGTTAGEIIADCLWEG